MVLLEVFITLSDLGTDLDRVSCLVATSKTCVDASYECSVHTVGDSLLLPLTVLNDHFPLRRLPWT